MTKEYKSKKYVKYIELHISCPNEEIADRITNNLVQNRLVACAQTLNISKSIYLWNGKIEKNEEVLIIAKTRSRYFPRIEKNVKKLHPYTTPEIIALPIVKVNDEYARWIDESLGLKIIDFENDIVVENK